MSPQVSRSEGVTAALCRFVAASRDAALPPAIERSASRAFVNWMGCALGGAHDSAAETTLAVSRNLSGRSDASVIGRAEKLDVVNAALVNAVAANALDYDDMHAPTLIHPTVPVIAAGLAVGQHRGISGRLLANAIAAGIEVECRLGRALFPAHYDAGWHISATLGTLGACASACVANGLDAATAQHAFGMAATQASGLRSMLDNSCKSFNIGKAASAGVLAALLAEAGLDSEPDVLEVKHGLFGVFGAPRDAQELTEGLGSSYVLPEVTLKPYPCGIVIHPLIDACLEIAGKREVRAENVRRVTARVHPRAVELAGRRNPRNALEGRYSLQHAAALALTRHSAGIAAFDSGDVADPELVTVRERIAVESDPRLTPGQAHVAVELTDGARLEATIDQPSGSPQRPLTESQLRSKFMELAGRALDAGAAERLYALCIDLPNVSDIRAIAQQSQCI